MNHNVGNLLLHVLQCKQWHVTVFRAHAAVDGYRLVRQAFACGRHTRTQTHTVTDIRKVARVRLNSTVHIFEISLHLFTSIQFSEQKRRTQQHRAQ